MVKLLIIAALLAFSTSATPIPTLSNFSYSVTGVSGATSSPGSVTPVIIPHDTSYFGIAWDGPWDLQPGAAMTINVGLTITPDPGYVMASELGASNGIAETFAIFAPRPYGASTYAPPNIFSITMDFCLDGTWSGAVCSGDPHTRSQTTVNAEITPVSPTGASVYYYGPQYWSATSVDVRIALTLQNLSTSTPIHMSYIGANTRSLTIADAGPQPMPEPATYALMGAGLAALAWFKRRRA